MMLPPLRKTTLVLLAVSIFAGANVTFADDWPRFRGPNGTGVADDQSVPVKWGKENILWKVPVPGNGNSSPVLCKGRLFLQSAAPDGSQRLLLCIDAKDGKTLWTRSVAGGKVPTHAKNTLSSSTPATDGERVYAAFWDGKEIVVAAFDLDGRPQWERNLGAFISQHGAGASPIASGGKVFFLNDMDKKATLYAFDARTGKTVWEKERPAYRACYGSPFLWEREKGVKELVVASTHEITGYDPDGGTVHWKWKWKHSAKFPLRVTASPVFADDMVFSSSGDGGGDRYMVAVKVNSNGGKAQGELVWSNKKDFPYVPSMISYKGLIFFVNDKGSAGCYQAKSGDRLWLERISELPFTASPVLAGGRIYAANEEGEVYVFAATPTLDLQARNNLGERVRATPAVANNCLFVRGQRHLFCIGTPKGK